MNALLWGNLFSLVGAAIMVAVGLLKKKEHVLSAQCVQFAIMGVGNTILGAYTAVVSNVVSILRNLISLRVEFTLPLKLLFIAIQAVFSFVFNDAGLIGWLPFAAVCIFTWALDVKSTVKFKWCIIFSQILWTVYDLFFRNYSAAVFDVLTIISTLVGIAAIVKENQKHRS